MRKILVIIIVIIVLLCLMFTVRTMVNRNDQMKNKQVDEVQGEAIAEKPKESGPIETEPSAVPKAAETNENDRIEEIKDDESAEGVIVLAEDEDPDSDSPEEGLNNGSVSYQSSEAPIYDEDELPPIPIN